MQYTRGQPGIQVIARAAAILRVCREEGGGLSLGKLAARVSLPRSTVQRIAGALLAEGFLQTNGEAGGLKLGPALAAISGGSEADVVEIAHPHLKRLAKETGETVDLALYRRDHMVFIDQVAGSHRLRAVSAVGEKFPLETTANGKAALAQTDRVSKELDAARKTGLAYDREEHTKGICAIGAAFKDESGRIYAISVPMPAIRYAKNRASVSAALKKTVRALRQALGLRP